MNELITKERLIQIGFESDDSPEFKYDVFSIRIDSDIEDPVVWIVDKLSSGDIAFPGAYTLKDLKDLMFFYYGEKEYTERFEHLPAEIVE